VAPPYPAFAKHSTCRKKLKQCGGRRVDVLCKVIPLFAKTWSRSDPKAGAVQYTVLADTLVVQEINKLMDSPILFASHWTIFEKHQQSD